MASQQERDYQAKLIKKLNHLFPGCVVLKNDSEYRQGIPDLIILYGESWAMLEVKSSANAVEQPNQRYYVELLDDMSFADFIYPENEEQVLHDLQRALQAPRDARLSRSQ